MHRISLLICFILILFFTMTGTISAQSPYPPALVLNPNIQISSNNANVLQLDLVNMGVTLSGAEIVIRVESSPWSSEGMKITPLEAPDWRYVDHYFVGTVGQPYQEIVIRFAASEAQGYNRGSSQTPIAQLSIPASASLLTAEVVAAKTTLFDQQGNPINNIQTFGPRTYSNSDFVNTRDTTIDPTPTWNENFDANVSATSSLQLAQLQLLEQQVSELKTQVDQQAAIIKDQEMKIQQNMTLLEKIRRFLANLFQFN